MTSAQLVRAMREHLWHIAEAKRIHRAQMIENVIMCVFAFAAAIVFSDMIATGIEARLIETREMMR